MDIKKKGGETDEYSTLGAFRGLFETATGNGSPRRGQLCETRSFPNLGGYTKAGRYPQTRGREYPEPLLQRSPLIWMIRIGIFAYSKHSGQFEISRSRNCFIIRAVAPQITWPL